MSSPPKERPENAFFRGLATLVLRFRVALMVGIALITVALGTALGRLRVDASDDPYLPPDDPATVTLESLRDSFGQDIVFKIIVEGDVFSPDYVKRLRALHEAIEAVDMPLKSLGVRRSDIERPKDEGPADDREAETAPSDPFADFGDDDDWPDATETAPEDEPGDEGWGDVEGGSVIEDVTSLINARRTQWRDDGLYVDGWLEHPIGAEDLRELGEHALQDRTLVGQLLGAEGHHSVIVVRTGFVDGDDRVRIHEAIEAITDSHRADGFVPEVGGFAAVYASLMAAITADMQLLIGLSLLVIILVMALVFRHPWGVLGPLFAMLLATAWLMGLMALLDVPITGLTNILPSFLICVGIADSIHIQSVYRDLRAAGVDNQEAIVQAVATTGVPVFFTTVTTAVGLWSFLFATTPAIRQLGLLGGIGVVLAMVQCLIVVPIALSFNRKSTLGAKLRRERRDWLDRVLNACDSASRTQGGSRRRARTIAAFTAVLTVLAVVGASQLKVTHDPIRDLPDGATARSATQQIDQHVGGTANVALLVDAPDEAGLKDRSRLQALAALESHVHEFRMPDGSKVVGNSTSLLDVVKESWRAVHEDDPEFYVLPDTQRGVSDMLTLFTNAGPERLTQLTTVDFRRALMVFRVRWLDAPSYGLLSAHVQQGIDALRSDGLRVRISGSVYNLFSIAGRIIVDLARSFGTAAGVIALIMIVLLRDPKLGLVAMVPNLLPIALLMAGMSALDIPLDFSNVLIASIAIGIAVDDTIHLLYQFKVHYRSHGDREAAVAHALQHTGRAVIITSITLALGFAVYMAASAQNVIRFGCLISTTVVLALVCDLVLTPALLRLGK